MVFYFLTCLQCSFQVTLTFQKIIHFTDWVVGHAHMVMFGVFSMWIMGMMIYLFPRLLKREWASQSLIEWHYWLSTIGLAVMAADLILLGSVSGLVMGGSGTMGCVHGILCAVLGYSKRGRSGDVWRSDCSHHQHLQDPENSTSKRLMRNCQRKIAIQKRVAICSCGNQEKIFSETACRVFRSSAKRQRKPENW
jgi:hypothetical protein